MQGVTLSAPLLAATQLPNGARFYRCALQVNPFAYLQRHNKPNPFNTENEYNIAMIRSCKEQGIEVISVTDHYRWEESIGLIKEAREAGLFVFSGVEAVTKDGVHYLCLFNPDKDNMIERFIGQCGIQNSTDLSPIGKFDSIELMACAREWGGISIAAHVAADCGGLLKKLTGQTRINVWTSKELLACALPASIDNAPENLKSILENKDASHRRDRPIAVINAQDVNNPDDLGKPGSSCFIKMSEISVEALRQAFLDPNSRIRLHTDFTPEPHTEFLAMTWEGGFLRDTAVHFNSNLNVLVGGRGTGKSTLIESIRYVLGLEPVCDDTTKSHQGVVLHVLRSGTKVSLLIRSHHPSKRYYTIERTVPNPPVIKDEVGNILALTSKDILPGVEVYGQHEISELTKNPEKLTLLLDRFIEKNHLLSSQKNQLRLDLERTRSRTLDIRRQISAIDERLTALPGLEETQKRYQEAGLEERFKEKSLLIDEENILKLITERLEQIDKVYQSLQNALPIDTSFLSSNILQNMPNGSLLAEVETILARLSVSLKTVAEQQASIIGTANSEIKLIIQQWEEYRKRVEESYEALLRELQSSKIDGGEFILLRRQITDLQPLIAKREEMQRELVALERERRNHLDNWENLKAAEYREIEKAAKKVSRKLKDKVRVGVTMGGNRAPLERLLQEEVGGLKAAIEKLRDRPELSLPDFAQKCREGKDSLIKHYKFPPGAAEKIAQASPDIFMRIEEQALPAITRIELNTASENDSPTWQSLDELSTGQKATAVLLLLLLESEAPLIVDQPEDDLDNRFITEGIVPIMREEKCQRQFVFSTHNANIPVLGDAELILGLSASGEGREGLAKIIPQNMGSIDTHAVRELVEDILEGGKTAFEMRRSKYGF